MTSTLAPPDANPLKKNDFIRQIIREDLAAGRHATVRTRFPPEPNGYLHLGHAKAIYLNFGIGQEFGGPVNLRFDDTNPAKEDPEYVEAIKEDVRWLGFEWAELRHASDYFEVFYRSDVPPVLSSTAIWSPIPPDQEIGREEAIYRRADHRLPARGGSRRGGEGPVPQARLQ
jgi:glutaminyl-tRNA synthetase